MPGIQEQIIAAFRKLRDDIRAFIETLPQNLEEPIKDNCK